MLHEQHCFTSGLHNARVIELVYRGAVYSVRRHQCRFDIQEVSVSPSCGPVFSIKLALEWLTMDPKTFMDIATVVTKLKMYPYFDIAHYVLMCCSVREDMPQGEDSEPCHTRTIFGSRWNRYQNIMHMFFVLIHCYLPYFLITDRNIWLASQPDSYPWIENSSASFWAWSNGLDFYWLSQLLYFINQIFSA